MLAMEAMCHVCADFHKNCNYLCMSSPQESAKRREHIDTIPPLSYLEYWVWPTANIAYVHHYWKGLSALKKLKDLRLAAN